VNFTGNIAQINCDQHSHNNNGRAKEKYATTSHKINFSDSIFVISQLKSAISTTSGFSKVEIFTYHMHILQKLPDMMNNTSTLFFDQRVGGHQPRRRAWIAACCLLLAGCRFLFALFAVFLSL